MPILEIAVNRPLPGTFHYSAENTPPEPVGCRVSVPFGSQQVTGMVVASGDTAPALPPGVKIRPIRRFIDTVPLIGEDSFRLADWLSRYYFCSLGQALATMVPAGIREMPLPGTGHDPEPLLALRPAQQAVFDRIRTALENNRGEKLLLHGVTGSGKTEVYRHTALRAAELGMGVLILIPEIALTPQTLARFAGIFEDKIALLHSRLTPAQRIGQWRAIREGRARVAIGARSAVFAPLPEPLCIILDEEHEQSYKAGDCPRYHARQVAFWRTRSSGCLVLGSATPSLETWYHAREGALVPLALTERISPHPPAALRTVDIADEPPGAVLSAPLLAGLAARKEKGEQSILFMNRRGYSTFIFCRDCDGPAQCPHCSISLNLHTDKNILLCHHCGYKVPWTGTCPTCSGKRIRAAGTGTQRVESFLAQRLPGLRQQRLDSDSIAAGANLEEVLARFRRKELDVLLGTQMVGKGLDFPDVTLAGVVFADSELNLPDFRSYERTFIQLTQVLGRSGRADKPGEGIIQTLQPESDPIASAVRGDLEGFYGRELARRREHRYPPFCRIIRIVCRSRNEEAARTTARTLRELLEPLQPPGGEILGPAPCPLEKISGNYRHHLLLKAPEILPLLDWVRAAGLAEGTRQLTYLEIDVDPLSLL